MKKRLCAIIFCGLTLLSSAVERTVDADFVTAPRSSAALLKKNSQQAVREYTVRNYENTNGMVILNNGKFAPNNANLIREIQIENLKRIQFRSCAGAASLAWATYDADGNLCRLGPAAQVVTTGAIATKEMPKYDITFAAREKVLCISVGKAVRSKLKLRYFTKSDASDAAEK